MKKRGNNEARDIQIARIAFIGATIATIGDGIAAFAAALALDALENPITDTRGSAKYELEDSKAQVDYYINELIKIRNSIQ